MKNLFFRLWRRGRWKHEEIVRSLGAPVELRTDPWGVVHLFARTEDDLFRAQGYVTARDRLFQMDMLRRTAAGRLAELYGDLPNIGFDAALQPRGNGLSSIDYLMRTIGLGKAAQDGLAWISPETHRALLSYSEGVNEYIEHLYRKPQELPLAYQMLNAVPEEWKPTDAMLIVRLLGFQLSFSWKLLLSFGAIAHRLSDNISYLKTLLPPHLSLSLGLEELPNGLAGLFRSSRIDAPSPSTPENQEKPLDHLFADGTGKGSCAWVVSGKFTHSGNPILSNDPHLLLRLPNAFYQIRLHAGKYNSIGLSIPGTVGVFIGHNEQIAWGTSLSRVDDADIFLEELDRRGEKFRDKDRFLPLIRREEIIKVKGESPKHRWVRSTRHGPLISDALRGPLPSNLTYSLQWTGQEAVREIEAIIRLNRANNWQQFLKALEYARVPSLSYVYADRSGNIGGIIAGKAPRRNHSPRIFRPLQGADGQHDWSGEIPFEEMPRLFNPESGFIVMSGQNPLQDSEHSDLQGFWELPFRARRIKVLLRRQFEKKLNTRWMARLQRDQYSLWSLDFIERHLAPYRDELQLDPSVRSLFELLLEWNGRVGAESIAGAYFAMFQLKLLEKGYRQPLGENLYFRWIDIAHELEPPIEPLFRHPQNWFEAEKKDLLRRALTQSYEELRQRLGDDPEQWTWSKLHRLTLRPLFFGGWQTKFSRGPFETGGDTFSINTGSHAWSRPFEHRIGAAARQIIDLGHWDHSAWILCGGQREAPHSPHYDDQLKLWLDGDDIPMYSSPIELNSMQQNWLLPEKRRPPDSYLNLLKK